MSAYRDPAGRDVVEGFGVDEGVEDGAPRGGVEDGTEAGGVIEGAEGLGMTDPDADPVPWYRPPTCRILCVPSRAGTSPWCTGVGPVRPVWDLHSLRQVGGVRTTGVWWRAMATLPEAYRPLLDARRITVTLARFPDRYWYSHLRGPVSRCLGLGLRPVTMVTWGPPNGQMAWDSVRHGRTSSHGGDQWCHRWTSRVLGPLWLWPDLQPHSRWSLRLPHQIDSYQTWFAPILPMGSGLVLDTRALALQGVPIPLPPALVETLRPLVRLLSLADLPTLRMLRMLRIPATSRPWLHEAPWLPGTTGRYSHARWQAFLDQFPDVPVWLPALPDLSDLPPWVQDRTHAPLPGPPSPLRPMDPRSVSHLRPSVRSLTQRRAIRRVHRGAYEEPPHAPDPPSEP